MRKKISKEESNGKRKSRLGEKKRIEQKEKTKVRKKRGKNKS